MQPQDTTPKVFNVDNMTDVDFGDLVKRRAEESEGHWNKSQKLKTVRAENTKDYLAKYVEDQLIDGRYQEVYVDNRQFVSVRTILPFLTARITAPEVIPASSKDLAIQFADDFEQVLQLHAERQQGRPKIRLAVQDLLKGERIGILMWRFDKATNTLVLEHVPPGIITIGKRSKYLEEPDFLRHPIERSVGDLITMFPEKKTVILKLFNLSAETDPTLEELDRVKTINMDWVWVVLDGKKQLLVGFSYQNTVFGKMKDPNWDEGGDNITDQPMMPYIFYNFLNDGKGWIDETSFMEQAHHSQVNYNKRGQTIAENAKYGGTGVPIFAKGAINQKDVAKIRFSPIQRILLDSTDLTKSFTTWQAQALPQYIFEDKTNLAESIDNIWAANAVLRGQQSENKTATQDLLNRNQAEGRMADPVDCIDDSMTRFYLLEAQLMYRYFDKEKYYNYKGNDGNFVSAVVSSKDIAKNLGIHITVRAGTSLPLDRAQRRATVMELLKLNKVGTLTAYKELGVFDDPEEAYKQYVMEQLDPKASLEEVDKQVFDREANEDIQIVLGGGIPDEREDITPEYVNYLNEWLLTDKFKLLQEKKASTAARLSQFIDGILAKAQRKADKLALQPAPDASVSPLAAMGAAQPPVGPPQPGQPPQAPPQFPSAQPQPPAPTAGVVPSSPVQ
jgi:hypothetical protein